MYSFQIVINLFLYFYRSLVSDAKSYRTSSKEREATFEVFPQHQTARLDDEGNHIVMPFLQDTADNATLPFRFKGIEVSEFSPINLQVF